ncbi:MAG: hypothetical protein ACXVP0_18790 [Bacteroidia bacterium]
MNKYSYDLVISASNENEADTKMKALTILARKLTARELDKLGNMVENDPVKTRLAKQALGV